MNSKTLQSLTDANASLKVMASPQKMQQYMDRHRIGPLFESLMNKVIHDQPDDPLIYLIKVLHKKAGLEVPRDLKAHGVRRNSPERIVRSKSPEMTKKTSQAWGSTTLGDVERSYDKPWLSSSKKVKPKSEDFSTSKQGRKQPKQPWNPDNKVGKTSFDDLFEDYPEETKTGTKKIETTDARQSWATMGLGDEEAYKSGVYRGPTTHSNRDDPLEGELMNSKTDTRDQTETDIVSSGHVKGRRLDAKKHRKELEKLIQKSEQKSGDSGYDEGLEEEDEAIELLEDANDLLNEGVTKIPKSGYKLSRLLQQRQQDANIKLNIKIADAYDGDPGVYKSTNVDDLFDTDEDRPATGRSGFRSSPGDSDEEFESVSQVTGPRRPVWNVGEDSDGDYSYLRKSKMSPELSLSRKQNSSMSGSRNLNQTVPVRFESSPEQSLDSFHKSVPNKTWTPTAQTMQSVESVRSGTGGWQIPRYDSETDFSEFGDQSTRNRPPRAY